MHPGETDHCKPDRYMGGFQDGTEIELTLNDIGPDTDMSIVQPDLDPTTTTDPLHAGSDDVNSDGSVDLRDAILSLQVSCGIVPESEVYPAADVDGNGKIGLRDAVFGLQKMVIEAYLFLLFFS